MTTPGKRSLSPAFQFYPNDFLGSTKVRLMSATEVGAYVLLLCANWLDGSLPNDIKRLAGIARMKPQQFERIWRNLLNECFVAKGDRLTNPRLEEERKKQKDYRRRQSDNAAQGWQRRRNATALPDISSRHTSGNALQSSSPSSISSSEKNKPLDAVFARFQSEYPAARRKGGYMVEQFFLRAYERIGDKIFEVLENHKASEQWQTPKLIPGMDTWFREERWRQELPPPKGNWGDWKPSEREAV